jgi:hypothetical protein
MKVRRAASSAALARVVLEDQGRGGKRLQQILELDRQHRLGLGERHQIDLGARHHRQRALGADQYPGQVERPRRVHELVEVVAADAAQDLGVAPVDLAGQVARGAPHHAVAGAFEGRRGGTAFGFGVVDRTEVRQRAVGQDHVLLEHVVDGLAV